MKIYIGRYLLICEKLSMTYFVHGGGNVETVIAFFMVVDRYFL